ncbi:hypothetical protein XENTR_v10023313 [Xenopus tropicalis]|nr:hypothetical protein XENTR_v10023313 [Xenopus tropicalis]
MHFVDLHRVALIARVSHIDPILDGLLNNDILTQEQYDTVRSKGTCQEKMRQLYDCVRAWGEYEKEKFYEYLLEYNGPLIGDLENN